MIPKPKTRSKRKTNALSAVGPVPSPGTRIAISILAGGSSLRMGRDKASLRLGGSTLLTLIRRTARQLNNPVRTIRHDRVARCGPLGGIYTALITSRVDAELFLACDMPFIDLALLQRLVMKYLTTGRPAFVRCDGRVGFPFLLPRDTAAAVKSQIGQKKFSIQTLASALDAAFVEISPRNAQPLLNVNTPAEFEEARRLWKKL